MLYYTQGGDFMEIKAKCKYDLDSVKSIWAAWDKRRYYDYARFRVCSKRRMGTD